jgi:hypothetical protein
MEIQNYVSKIMNSGGLYGTRRRRGAGFDSTET